MRELRDLTRTRAKLTNDRSKEHQRLEKLREDAGVKLSTVATHILGVSGQLMLEALCAGVDAVSVSRSRASSSAPATAAQPPAAAPCAPWVATEHSMATAMWHMLTRDVPYLELGGDCYARRDPERAKARIAAQAKALGLAVTFTPIEDAPAT